MTNDSATNDAVVIERTLDAPVGRVWEMWTEPSHFRAWYGPMGASIPKADMDVRVGGRRLVAMEMQTPNGPMQMWFTGEYVTVDPTSLLVYTESMSDETGRVVPPAEMGMPEGHPEVTEIVVALEPAGDGTKMVLTHRGVPADSPGAMGWNMALDKLTTYLADSAG
ncbi:SRPBCC family protein [Ilumatobacter sp.]|uniref:SRPBCC family protein n=1 Tax=Ilumatobacter sp. TaxID=1967498 RepID=UPI003AF59DAD